MARLAAELAAGDAIHREIDGDPRLSSEASRTQAFRALASYVASALVFPSDRFHADAVAARYDVQLLRHHYGASFKQVAPRTVTLPRPGPERIPFASLRPNPAHTPPTPTPYPHPPPPP